MPNLFRTILAGGQPWRAAAGELAPVLAGLAWLVWIGAEARRAELSPAARRSWTFPLEPGARVTVRSSHAPEAEILRGKRPGCLVISARPRLLTEGVHRQEADGRQKQPGDWPFTWVLEREGALVKLHARGEVRGAGYRYLLDEVRIEAPAEVLPHLEKGSGDPSR